MRLMLTVVAAVALTGCKGPRQRSLLDTIPASATMVAQVDLDQLLKMAACGSQDGAITLTSDINTLLARADSSALALLQSAAEMGYCLDLQQLFVFRYDGQLILTAPRKAETVLQGDVDRVKIVTLGSTLSSELPYGTTVLATPHQGWIALGKAQRVSDLVDKAVADADIEPLTARTSIVAYLTAPFTGKIYVDVPKEYDNPFGQNAAAMMAHIQVRDRSIEWAAEFVGKGTAGCPFSELAPIDAATLEEMPAGAIAYVAIGLGPNTISRLGPLRKRLPFTTQLAVDAIVALSDPEGGTMAIGAAPGGHAETIKKINLDNWLVRAMLPMGDKAADAAKLINKFAPENLYCYALDDALAITSYDAADYPAAAEGMNPPENARVWVWAQVPYRSQLMKAMKITNGYQFETWATACEVRGELRIMGQAQYILPALIRDLNAN